MYKTLLSVVAIEYQRVLWQEVNIHPTRKSQPILRLFARRLLTTLPGNTSATQLAASIAILFVDVFVIRRNIKWFLLRILIF